MDEDERAFYLFLVSNAVLVIAYVNRLQKKKKKKTAKDMVASRRSHFPFREIVFLVPSRVIL